MKIAVIVPVRNEEDSISILLDGLLKQTRTPDEIVITDGGSTDATPSIIDGYVKRGAPIQLVRARAALPGRGRNLAATAASCEWLAFIDAGIRPERDWLEKLATRAGDGNADVVYGAWHPVTDSFFKECAVIAYVPPPELRDGILRRPRFIASTLMRREVWRAVGGFPQNLRSAEDLLFMNRIDKANFRTVHEPDASVHWDVQPTLWRTFKRFVVYARNNIRAGLWRQWQAAIFQRYLWLGILALPAIFLGSKWLVIPLTLWLVLLTARSANAIRKNRRSYPAGIAHNALRLFMLMPILATLDAAAFAGSLGWLCLDKFGLARTTNHDDSHE
jgi:glycosyltransferase involved in cell wall biosynthesis